MVTLPLTVWEEEGQRPSPGRGAPGRGLRSASAGSASAAAAAPGASAGSQEPTEPGAAPPLQGLAGDLLLAGKTFQPEATPAVSATTCWAPAAAASLHFQGISAQAQGGAGTSPLPCPPGH